MTTLSRLSDLPNTPLRLMTVKDKADAERIAANYPEAWYHETEGKYPKLFVPTVQIEQSPERN